MPQSAPAPGVAASQAAAAAAAPKNLRILLVERSAPPHNVLLLLKECGHQVSTVRTNSEVLQALQRNGPAHDKLRTGSEGPPAQAVATWLSSGCNPASAGTTPCVDGAERPFDMVLKEHEPPQVNACRLLRRMAAAHLLHRFPVVLVSSNDDREVVLKCLTLGAIDYLIKPLRHNEMRHLWTRVWWWRQQTDQGTNPSPWSQGEGAMEAPFASSPGGSLDTKCEDDEGKPGSKDGSAGIGSNGSGNQGSNKAIGKDPAGSGSGNNRGGRQDRPAGVLGNDESGNNSASATKAGPGFESSGGCNGDRSNGNGSNGNGSNGDGSNGNRSNGDRSNGNGSNGNGQSVAVATREGSAFGHTAEGLLKAPGAAGRACQELSKVKCQGLATHPKLQTPIEAAASEPHLADVGLTDSGAAATTAVRTTPNGGQAVGAAWHGCAAAAAASAGSPAGRPAPQIVVFAAGSNSGDAAAGTFQAHPSCASAPQKLQLLSSAPSTSAGAAQGGVPLSRFALPAPSPATAGVNASPPPPALMLYSRDSSGGMQTLYPSAVRAGYVEPHHHHYHHHHHAEAMGLPHGLAPSSYLPLYHARSDGLGAVAPPAQLQLLQPRACSPMPAAAGGAAAGFASQQQQAAAMQAHSAWQHYCMQQHVQHAAVPMLPSVMQLGAAGGALVGQNHYYHHHHHHASPHHGLPSPMDGVSAAVPTHRPSKQQQLGFGSPAGQLIPGHARSTLEAGQPPDSSGLCSSDAGADCATLSVAERNKRRAAALQKYRSKRQRLKFGKTIRYKLRKQLADQRPRIKGQFVKHASEQPQQSTGCGEHGGCAGQNFDGGSEGHDYEDGSADEDGGGSGIGTMPDADDAKDDDAQVLAERQRKSGSSQMEEDGDVVNSLQQLQEGPAHAVRVRPTMLRRPR